MFSNGNYKQYEINSQYQLQIYPVTHSFKLFIDE